MKDFLIIGTGRFGASLAETLFNKGQEVVIVDSKEASVESIMDKVSHAIIMDATNEEALKTLDVSNFHHVIIAIGSNLEASILATVLVKGQNAQHIICRADSAIAARVLSSVGADEIVRPAHDMGVRLAEQLVTPNLLDSFDLGNKHSVIEIEVPKDLTGKLKTLSLPHRFGVQVIAINQGEKLKVSPNAEFEIFQGDRLVVIGANEDLDKLKAFLVKSK